MLVLYPDFVLEKTQMLARLKLCLELAKHNFKWGNIYIFYPSTWRVSMHCDYVCFYLDVIQWGAKSAWWNGDDDGLWWWR